MNTATASNVSKEEEDARTGPVETALFTQEMFYDQMILTLKDVVQVLELRKEGKDPFASLNLGKKKRKKTANKDPSEKRPLSGYQLYVKEHMQEVKQENSDKGGQEVFKLLANMWNSSEEKKEREAQKASALAEKKENGSERRHVKESKGKEKVEAAAPKAKSNAEVKEVVETKEAEVKTPKEKKKKEDKKKARTDEEPETEKKSEKKKHKKKSHKKEASE
eukprot:CAMPEP_0196575552 /NCGR_PEP_ID=MMETSP1081-20130531/5006_1 /TAXON_ID=36882 /ORGANISM="Pyramimonas amylifera, Strain CCMP720" /LENGTH=220 /DNA_ID=CAMNT_0041893891 /DNA_START=97 /DNA_END=759 /DNA_ORIENTATION=+